jgi:pilus assembly protein CpaB
MRTDLLIANVRVLAIDQTANESRNDPQVARAVTIEVTPEDGQKVALATEIGTLSLALRRADEIGPGVAAPAQAGTIRINDLQVEGARSRPQQQQTQPAPRRPAPARTVRTSGPAIEIVRGFTTNHTPVASE